MMLTIFRNGVRPFTASLIFNQNSFCVRAAPIIGYMRGWSLAHVVKYVHNRGWTYEIMEDHNAKR